jgi:hypothetical protein
MTVSIAKTTVSVTATEYAVLMKDYGENEVLREKLVPVPYCPPQIPDRLALERTWATKAISQPLLIVQQGNITSGQSDSSC